MTVRTYHQGKVVSENLKAAAIIVHMYTSLQNGVILKILGLLHEM